MPRISDLGFRADTAAGWAAAEVGGVATSAGENVWVDNDLVKCDGVTKVASLPRAGSGTYATRTALLARDRRTNAARFDASTMTLARLVSTGLSLSGGVISATVGGTDGTACLPIYRPQPALRASARITMTKSTASSKSYIGFTTTAPGTIPSGSDWTFGVGYLQGTGLVLIKENVGAPIVIVADGTLVDGAQYDLSLAVETAMSTAGGGSGYGSIIYRLRTTAGADLAWGGTTFINAFVPGNIIARTNVAAGALSNVQMSAHLAGAVAVPTVTSAGYATGGEDVLVHVPAQPNGKLVIACHGHGGGAIETGWTSAYTKPIWDHLVSLGYTIAVPKMGGDLWGNPAAQAYLRTVHGYATSLYDLDPDTYLWGNSMGGGAALTAIALGTIPVRAAWVTNSVCDLAALWANPSYTTLPAAYGNSTTARDASNPMALPAASFAGVPIAFVASAGDTAIAKTAHTDAMRTRLAGVTDTYLVTATGNHNTDASQFPPYLTGHFFGENH